MMRYVKLALLSLVVVVTAGGGELWAEDAMRGETQANEALLEEQRKAIAFMTDGGKPVDICRSVNAYAKYFHTHKTQGTSFETVSAKLDYLAALAAGYQGSEKDIARFFVVMKALGRKIYESKFLNEDNLPLVSHLICRDMKRQLLDMRRGDG